MKDLASISDEIIAVNELNKKLKAEIEGEKEEQEKLMGFMKAK